MALYLPAASLTAQQQKQNNLNNLSQYTSGSSEFKQNECSAAKMEGGARVASH